MEAHNVIVTLYPAPNDPFGLALETILSTRNSSCLVEPMSEGNTTSRNSPSRWLETPEPDEPEPSWLRSPGLQLRFDSQRKQRRGFVFGRDRRLCDIVFTGHQDLKGVSNIQCLFGFDEDDRLTVTDLRETSARGDGTAVTYNNKGGEKRRGFTWILSGTSFTDRGQDIIISFHDYLKSLVVLPNNHTSSIYRQKVADFRAGLMVEPGSISLARLNFDHTSSTTTFPSGAQTPGTGPLFLKSNTLGTGAFAVVIKVYNVSTGMEYARKRPSSKHCDKKRWRKEADLLRAISHAHVVRLLDADFSKIPTLYLELVPGGTLWSQHRYLSISRDESLTILLQMLSALEYLHGQKPPVVHRDIKPQNILVQSRSPQLHVKLTDFGLSEDKQMTTFCGTSLYLAPEVNENRGKRKGERQTYGPAVDIWSLGVMVFEFGYGLPRVQLEGLLWCQCVIDKLSEEQTSDLVEFLRGYMLLWDSSSRGTASGCLDSAPRQLDDVTIYSQDVPVAALESREPSSTNLVDPGSWSLTDDPSTLRDTIRGPRPKPRNTSLSTSRHGHKRTRVQSSSSLSSGRTRNRKRASQRLSLSRIQPTEIEEESYGAKEGFEHDNWLQDPLEVGSEVADLLNERPTLFRSSYTSRHSQKSPSRIVSSPSEDLQDRLGPSVGGSEGRSTLDNNVLGLAPLVSAPLYDAEGHDEAEGHYRWGYSGSPAQDRETHAALQGYQSPSNFLPAMAGSLAADEGDYPGEEDAHLENEDFIVGWE